MATNDVPKKKKSLIKQELVADAPALTKKLTITRKSSHFLKR